jgi:hypothetical protein
MSLREHCAYLEALTDEDPESYRRRFLTEHQRPQPMTYALAGSAQLVVTQCVEC